MDHLDCTMHDPSCDSAGPKIPPMHLFIFVCFALCEFCFMPICRVAGLGEEDLFFIFYTFTDVRLSKVRSNSSIIVSEGHV